MDQKVKKVKKTESKKRRPGRPRTKPLPKPIPKKGVLDRAEDKDNAIEMSYDCASDFKKINTYLKNLSADILNIKFDREGFAIYGINHMGTVKARIRVDGTKCVSYYCAEPIDIKVQRSNLDMVLNIIGGEYLSIDINLRYIDMNTKFYIIFKNTFGFMETFGINVILDYEARDAVLDSDFEEKTEPKVEFNLRGGFFKKLITNTKNFNKQITVRKVGRNSELEIQYNSTQSQVEATITPSKGCKNDLDLKQNLGENEIFAVSIYSDNLRSTSHTNICDLINIKLWTLRPVFTTASLNDGAIVFNIRTKIIGCEE